MNPTPVLMTATSMFDTSNCKLQYAKVLIGPGLRWSVDHVGHNGHNLMSLPRSWTGPNSGCRRTGKNCYQFCRHTLL